MLNHLDDYPVHQTPEPLAHPATSERNFYDRTWFNGYAADGSYYFALGMAIYPHRGILDCAFSVVEAGGRQHSFYGSRRAPAERTEMQVGPFRIEIIEPMRRARVVLEDNPSGIRCELTFSARTACIEESRQTLWAGTRRVLDNTRFDQFGRWSGHIRHPEGEIDVADSVCYGTKDRSWGFRRVGEPDSGGAPVEPDGIFFLWAPLVWEDHVTHALFFDDSRGRPLMREGISAPLYSDEAFVTATNDSREERMVAVDHRVEYHLGTRLAKSAQIELTSLQGETRTIHLDPVLRFQMKGLGYRHPEWGHGMWRGELEVGSESIDLQRIDLLAPENLHVQQVVQARDDQGRQGLGVLEQLVAGPYPPASFRGFQDGAAE